MSIEKVSALLRFYGIIRLTVSTRQGAFMQTHQTVSHTHWSQRIGIQICSRFALVARIGLIAEIFQVDTACLRPGVG